jgi:hypothetical protein
MILFINKAALDMRKFFQAMKDEDRRVPAGGGGITARNSFDARARRAGVTFVLRPRKDL